jgi:hypothetical protein
VLGGVGCHLSWEGGEGTEADLFGPQFYHRVNYEGLAVIMCWEGEKRDRVDLFSL